MTGAYGEDYYRSVYPSGELRRFSPSWWSARFYAAVARRLLRRAGGRRVLEIGCGLGWVLALLGDDGDVTGVDVSAYAVDSAARRVPRGRFFLAGIEEGLPAGAADTPYDLVLARYVLEHLADPAKAVRVVREALRPGGFFFLSVPNTDSLGRRLKGPEWYAHKDPTHVSLLAPEAWLRMLNEAGFAVERETADGWWDLPYLRGVPRRVQAPFFLAPTALMCLTGLPLLPRGWGENLLVIARKPARR